MLLLEQLQGHLREGGIAGIEHTWLGFRPPAVLARRESLNCSFASGSPPVTDLFQLIDV